MTTTSPMFDAAGGAAASSHPARRNRAAPGSADAAKTSADAAKTSADAAKTSCRAGITDRPKDAVMRLLVIEDDDVDVEFLRRMLTLCPQPKFEVHVLDALAPALKAIADSHFDVVLVDLNLPDSDGLDAVAQIRLLDARVPVVVLTGLQDEDVAMQAIELGAQDFLSKINLTLLTLVRSIRFSVARQLKFLGLEATADLDPLTGLPNRRGLENRFESVSRRCRMGGSALMLAIFDIDHFKTINDRHGHFVGDVVLQTFADRIRLMVRPDWWICRFGGEEFALLIPDDDITSAQTHLRDWLARLGTTPMRVGGASMTVTASGGLISVKPDEDWNNAYVRCDRALYAAKSSGRNQLVSQLD